MEYIASNCSRTRSKSSQGVDYESAYHSRYTDHPIITGVSDHRQTVKCEQMFKQISDHPFTRTEWEEAKTHGLYLFGDCEAINWKVEGVHYGTVGWLTEPSNPPEVWQSQGWGSVIPYPVALPAGPGPEAEAKKLATVNELLQRALAKGHSPSWNALTSYAEFGKTVKTFTGLSKELNSYAERALSKARSRSKRFRDRKEALEDAWLSYRFAIRPVVTDLKHINQWAQDALFEFDRNVGRASYEHKETIKVPFNTGYAGVTHSCEAEFNCTTRWFCGALYTCEVRKGLEVTANPLLTAWELLPLSFFVDRFINIAGLLRMVNFSRSMKFHTSWLSERIEIEGYTVNILDSTVNPSYLYSHYEPGSLDYRWLKYSRRRVLADLDTFRPFFQERPIKNMSQLIDSAVLLDKLKWRVGSFLNPWNRRKRRVFEKTTYHRSLRNIEVKDVPFN